MDLLFTLPFSLLVVFPLWRIYERAGLTPPLALLVFLPYLGPLLAVAILAFADWPAQAPGGWVRRPEGPPPGPGAPR